jgi:hypothetical protein
MHTNKTLDAVLLNAQDTKEMLKTIHGTQEPTIQLLQDKLNSEETTLQLEQEMSSTMEETKLPHQTTKSDHLAIKDNTIHHANGELLKLIQYLNIIDFYNFTINKIND